MAELKHGFTCYWRIENFYIEKKSPSCLLKSQIFDVLMLRDSTWYLELKHQLFKPSGLFLYKEGPQENSNIDIEMSILTTNGWRLLVEGPCKGLRPGEWAGAPESIDLDDFFVQKHLLNGYLTVSCHMSNGATRNRYEQCVMRCEMISRYRIIYKSFLKFKSLKPNDLLNFSGDNNLDILPFNAGKKVSIKSTQTESKEDINIFNDLEDILKLFKDQKFRYVTLRTARKDFVVHKALLCARSPVFNAMFFHRSMKENASYVVDINDIDDGTLSLMVQFLHLDPIGSLEWDDAAKLYYAADKYQIELLKKECLSSLKKDLSDNNICDTFIFADAHQDEELRQTAQEYFCRNSKTILRSSEWRDLLHSRADLASEILYELAENL